MNLIKFFGLLFSVLLFRLMSMICLVLSLLIPFLRDRREFEKRNNLEPSRPFHFDGASADVTIHVSSEGELEQVRPIIDWYLTYKKKIELLFTSPSVEKKVERLYNENKDCIRILRLPLILNRGHHRLFRWVSSDHLIMVRYDFFPSLLLMSRFCSRMTLLWATLKGKNESFFTLYPYYFFNQIIPATKNDFSRLSKLFKFTKGPYDFRVHQISSRIEKSESVLKNKGLSPLNEYIKTNFLKMERIVFGSVWPIDLEKMSTDFVDAINSGEIFVTFCPHKIDRSSIIDLEHKIKKESPSLRYYVLDKDFKDKDIQKLIGSLKEQPGLVINTVPGVLCEFYSLFGQAYVGGGFGRSIHSVLEPYLNGLKVFCGPLTHRSTEYDLVREFDPESIVRVDGQQLLYESIIKSSKTGFENKSEQMTEDYKRGFSQVISEIVRSHC